MMGVQADGTDWNTLNMLLTVKDAGERLGIGRNSVYALVNSGELRVVNVAPAGRRPRLRIRLDDLQAFIDSKTHDPPTPTQVFDAANQT
jgi:excisionase family DNA binding protein